MPRSKQISDFIVAYESLGLSFDIGPGDERIADCPFCDGENKFYVNESNGKFCCHRCKPAGGNLTVFLRDLWAFLAKEDQDYSDLCKSRGILSIDTCKKWGVVKGLTGYWLAPGFNSEGKLVQLYRYIKVKGSGKYRLLPVRSPNVKDYIDDSIQTGEGQGIHMDINVPNNKSILLCEGLWDGMVLSEIVKGEHRVMSVPGCNVFKDSWSSMFSGKDVTLLFDNDHPSSNGVIPGLNGTKKVSSTLWNSSRPPKSLSYLKWGDCEGYYSESLVSGYDVRDYLTKGSVVDSRRRLWKVLQQDITPVPSSWLEKPSIRLAPSECESWRSLIQHWKKAAHWPEPGDGLDYALSVMLAVITSTPVQGDQLWVRLIGPPSCGKTILCEAISVAKSYVKSLSRYTGLYSGYRNSKDDSDDSSLITKLNGKTLVIKDADPLLQSGILDKLLGELRDAYDGSCSTHYNNRMGRDYEGFRFSLIVAGTKSICKMDASERGERFLDCIALDKMADSLEREIRFRVAMRAASEVKTLVNCSSESLLTPEMADARKKTGGYVEYLRENAESLLSKVEITPADCELIGDWADFTSFIRTKEPIVSVKGQPKVEPQREMSFRLTSQLIRMAACIAAVLGEKRLTSSVLSRTKKVAIDTARGNTMEMVKCLYEENGASSSTLETILGRDHKEMLDSLVFLDKIEVVEKYKSKCSNRYIWRLRDKVKKLYKSVVLE